MKKPRYYFSDHDEESCYTLKSMYDYMDSEGLNQLTIYPAKMVTGENFFYCNHFLESGTVGEGCGRFCKAYQPRNGKNGRCRFSMNGYEAIMENPIIITSNEKAQTV